MMSRSILPPSLRTRCISGVVALLCLLTSSVAAAETRAAVCQLRQPHQYIARFVQYVRWPDEIEEQPWTVCVAPSAIDAAALYVGAHARGRGFEVRSVDSVEQARACHVLDTSGFDSERRSEFLVGLSREPVLTVGLGREFCNAGGQICLTDEAHVRFEINLSAMQQARLRANARLLRLGKRASMRSIVP